MKQIKFVTILLILQLFSIVGRASVTDLQVFSQMTQELKEVFEDMEMKGEILDNGYFSSFVLSDTRAIEFGDELKSRREILNAIKDSLFTVFAYASLSPAQKERAAQDFLVRLDWYGRYYDMKFYRKVNRPVGGFDLTILEDTCSVGGPDLPFLISIPSIDDRMVLQLSSDVCD